MVSPGWSIGCVLLMLVVPLSGLEVVGYDSQQVICSQGLSACTMKDDFMPVPRLSKPENEAVAVRNMTLQALLCCSHRAQCAPCLRIRIQLHVHPNRDMEDGGPSGLGDDDSEVTSHPEASVRVCYSIAGGLVPVCKRVEFTVNHEALTQQNTAQLSMVITKPAGVSFGSRVFIYAPPTKPHQEVVMPSLDEVCSPQLQERIEECEVPTLSSVIDQGTNQLALQVVGKNEKLVSQVCLQNEKDGKCTMLNNRTIPLYSVTSCLCLQVWWDKGDQRSRRSLRCPFINDTDVFQRNIWRNVSVSVVQGRMSNNKAMLSWNVSAPCRLEAEVWPCHKTAGVGEKNCKEMKGFRQQLLNINWRQNSKEHWEKTGVFEDINLKLSPCVMVKVKGMQKELGPFCFNDTSRWRWSLLVVAVVLLVWVTALIFCLLRKGVKSWAWNWHYSRCTKIERKGHVVLLSPPDVDSVAELVSGLDSLLCGQGFSVSVDQWCRREQSTWGPVPWLHSQLQKLDSLGGQVVLVLTQKAWERAEEWTRQCKRAQGMEGGRTLPQVLSPYSDVFMASLCIIQADKNKGRAGERFLLVNFDSHPAQPPSCNRSLPELLQGVPLFHLPSQTEALLSRLRRGRASGKRRWTEQTKGLNEQRMPPHKYQGVEKNWETKPLKPEQSKVCHDEYLYIKIL